MTISIGGILARFQKLWHSARPTPQTMDNRSHSTTVSPDVRASFHDDGVVFLDVRGGTVFRSNRIGAAIWKGLIGRQELATIAAQIGREYSITAEQAMEDASSFVAQLESHGFLVCRAGARV
jgi:hypothetical protein